MQRSEVKFEKGSILRKEMLEDLYEYPRVALESYYSRFSDGILYGLEWGKSCDLKGHHLIMPGALKFHGNIYFLPKCIDVENLLKDEIIIDQKYRLCFMEKEEQKNIEAQTIYKMELKAIQSKEYNDKKDKLFYYARVRCLEENSLEIFEDGDIYGLYAAYDGYDYQLPHCLVKKSFIELIEKKKNKHPLDYMLLKEFYQGNGLLLSFVKMYLSEAKVSFQDNDFLTPSILIDKMKTAVDILQLNLSIDNNKEDDGNIFKDNKQEKYSGGLL